MTQIIIPKRYVMIQKEKEHPTSFVLDRKTGQLRGRILQGQPRKKGNLYGPFGRTKILRLKQNYGGVFSKGQIIGRTKKIYPKQPNSTMVRTKTGSLKSIKIERHNRKSKKGRNHLVKKHSRKVYKN